jgi:hypothetical protein
VRAKKGDVAVGTRFMALVHCRSAVCSFPVPGYKEVVWRAKDYPGARPDYLGAKMLDWRDETITTVNLALKAT